MRSTPARFMVVVIAAVALSLGVGASEARPARQSGTVAISMLANANKQPAYAVLIPNFERVYPNITVNVTYAASSGTLGQLETTELAAGDAPDLLATYAGCGGTLSVCLLAPEGYLAPLVEAPWVRWSLPLVTSLDKNGQGLFAFTPTVSPEAIFTNDGLFSKLGLRVPQTFSQLLMVCQEAKAAGTAGIVLGGAGGTMSVPNLILDLAVATVYGQDKQWAGELRAGKVTFDGAPGWQQALQEFIDMNNAGCFQPGIAGTTSAAAAADFAQGQGLMYFGPSNMKGTIDAASPQFAYSFHPFPGGTVPNQTSIFLAINDSVGLNAHSSAQNQAAARMFVDFIARPKEDALFAQTTGGLTQFEFLKGQIPAFMSSLASVFKDDQYVVNPSQNWWNPNVYLTLEQDGIGLITGQESIAGVLTAMDAAWQQGHS